MTLRIGFLALLACLLVLPASAHASALRVTVVIHGPGKVTGSGSLSCVSTVGNGDSKVCGTVTVGQDDEVSSTSVGFSAAANAAQPNKSTFVKWTCTTVSGASCGGCATSSGCQILSELAKGFNDVLAVAEFSDTTAPSAPTVTRTFSDTVDRQVGFDLTSNDTIAKSLCSLDGAPFTTCPRDMAFILAAGTHTFAAKVVDPSDLTSLASATSTIHVVDTALTDGPADASRDASPTFRYSGLAGVAFECSLDGAAYSACGTGNVGTLQVGPLADGAHTFRVRAKDGADYDHVPATRAWTVDRTPPVAALDPFTGPGQGALQAVDAETFAFSLNEAGATECSLDGTPFAACASPLALSGLAPGAHAFRVRGTDSAGNVGTPVTRSWSVSPRDGDGDGADLRADCDDANPAIHPGAAEIAGNGVDENCDGRDAPGPAAAAPKPSPLTFKLTATGKGTKLKSLRVTGVPKGATVTVTCKGRGCPKKRYVKRNASGTVNLAAFRRLPTTATLTVTVSHDGATAVRVLKTRTAKAPRITNP